MAARISPPRRTWRFPGPIHSTTVVSGRIERVWVDDHLIGGLQTVHVDIQADDVRRELTGEPDPEAAHVYADMLEEMGFAEAAAALRKRVPIPVVKEPRPIPRGKPVLLVGGPFDREIREFSEPLPPWVQMIDPPPCALIDLDGPAGSLGSLGFVRHEYELRRLTNGRRDVFEYHYQPR